ncbi:MAG: sigma-54-dependent Fis family transcriptional regulator [Nitrospirae bacterium]|nr:MAG: sigma-54-dependent Fis family transcriptional regulator [Nitrospirota bacterium]
METERHETEAGREGRILVIDDEPLIVKLLKHNLEKMGYEVLAAGNGREGLEVVEREPVDVILLDIMMPEMDGMEVLRRLKAAERPVMIIMLTAKATIDTAVQCMKEGAHDFLSKPFDMDRLQITIRNALHTLRLSRQVEHLRAEVSEKFRFDQIIGKSRGIKQVCNLVAKVLDVDITVLITGESGTGKELIARAIHYRGRRKDGPFVTVNCAAIPENLLESELFGHERGSFSGAVARRTGKFEQADGGTIFLDEIGEMDLALQAKILRVLQEREVERVGGHGAIPVDVRVVAATNRNLEELIQEGKFREDLYYRIAAFPIEVPALRERRDDIPLLAHHFLKQAAADCNKRLEGFTDRAMEALMAYDWPGNVRELENVISRAALLATTHEITCDDLPSLRRGLTEGPTPKAEPVESIVDLLPKEDILPFEVVEERIIRHALALADGNVTAAANRLQISRATLYRKLKSYGIEV